MLMTTTHLSYGRHYEGEMKRKLSNKCLNNQLIDLLKETKNSQEESNFILNFHFFFQLINS